jgi:hypothetical protein
VYSRCSTKTPGGRKASIAICALNARAGAGIVVRIEGGELIAAEGRRYDHVSDPFTTEHACASVALSVDDLVVSYDCVPGFLAEVVSLDFMSSIE